MTLVTVAELLYTIWSLIWFWTKMDERFQLPLQVEWRWLEVNTIQRSLMGQTV